MIKALCIVLMALPLVSFGPAPFPLERAIVRRPALASIVTPRQSCDAAAARRSGTYLRQIVYDPTGAPYGEVAAWSCTGDAASAIAELRARQAALEAEAAAFRAQHPIGRMPAPQLHTAGAALLALLAAHWLTIAGWLLALLFAWRYWRWKRTALDWIAFGRAQITSNQVMRDLEWKAHQEAAWHAQQTQRRASQRKRATR